MRVFSLTSAVALALAGLLVISRADTKQAEDSCCSLVMQALTDAQRISVGTSRKVVEQTFELDGGLQATGAQGGIQRYNFKKCELIKINITFKRAHPDSKEPFALDDTVTKVSKPYIEYPSSD